MNNGTERRRTARVELMGRLHGRLVPADLAVAVREISLGGMSIQSSQAFELGSVLSFMLTLGDGAGVLVASRVVYSRPLDGADGAFVTGLEFIDDDNGDRGVSEIVDKVR